MERTLELEEEKIKCEKALNQREDVRQAVDQAGSYAQDQVDLIELLERYDGDPEKEETVH